MAIEAKRAAERQNRARWRRWEELELQARARADLEADIESAVAREVDGRFEPGNRLQSPAASDAPLTGSLLARRLDAARRGETAPLALRIPTD